MTTHKPQTKKSNTTQEEDTMTQTSATQQGSKHVPDHSQFNTDRSHPGRWTITFNNPPINMFVPTTIHSRPRYMVACTPRVYGYCPGYPTCRS